MNDAIKRASEAGQQLLKALSGQMLEEWRARQFFPSTDASDRKFVSPLGGQAKHVEKPTTKPTTNNRRMMKW